MALKQHQNATYVLAQHVNKESLLDQKDLPFRIQGCATQAVLTSPYPLRHPEPSQSPTPTISSQNANPSPCSSSSLRRSYTLAVQQLSEPKSKGTPVPNRDIPPHKAAFEVSLHPAATLSNEQVQELQAKLAKDVRLSPKPILGSRSRVSPVLISAALQQVVSHKRLPAPVAAAASIPKEDRGPSGGPSCRPHTKPRASQPTVDSACKGPQKQHGEASPRPSQMEVPLRSPDGDSQLVPNSCQPKGSQEEKLRLSNKVSQKDGGGPASPAHPQRPIPPGQEDRAQPGTDLKVEATSLRSPATQDPKRGKIQRGPRYEGLTISSVPSKLPEKVLDVGPLDPDIPATPKVLKAPFRFRNLFSATFPTWLKKETDERQAQLQKVKQYELEFLEELLKPKAKGDPPSLPEYLLPSVPGRCSCQLKTSPVQKGPGMSREQRRSCDCKRISRGARPQPNEAAAPELERRGRDRAPRQQAEVARGSGMKSNRVRSTSLELRGSQSEPENGLSCLTTCASQAECMGAPQYKKLMRRYSVSEIDKVDRASPTPDIYQESKAVAVKNVSQEGPAVGSEPACAQLAPEKKSQKDNALCSLQEGVYPSHAPLSAEEDMEAEKCCSIRYCFYYRKCDGMADDGSEKDELSYSVPTQILPGMKLDNHQPVPVVSRTLQVLDATACSSPDDNQTQEIDLRTTTYEGSLAKIHALQGQAYAWPDGFLAVQLDTSKLLTVLRQCVVNPEGRGGKAYLAQLVEHTRELALKFKEFRAACRRVAAVDKSPTHMLSAISSSFQVLGSLIETFVRLVYVVRSETQRQALLAKVEEVVRNYTFLLRAAEESTARTVSHRDHTAEQSVMNTFTRSLKTLISK